MATYICLLLDPHCKVMRADIITARDDARATTEAIGRSQEARSWGYELWRGGRQVVALYDCKHPPARIGMR